MTYTFIALPGVMLSFSALQSLLREFWNRICGGSEVPGCLRALFNAAALLLQMLFCTGLILVPLTGLRFDGYENMIRAMAYSSATFLIGVKLLGTICHGPEVTRLVEKVTDAEVRFEASLQLILLGTIYLVSGKGSSGSLSSAVTSLLVIGKVGIQGVFKEHNKELSKASLLGKIYVATSVAPVFVLAAVFKIGSIAAVFAEGTKIKAYGPFGSGCLLLLCLTSLPPTLAIFFVKICVPLKDLTSASISQGVFAEAVSLHTWSGGRIGRRIKMAMGTYYHLLYSAFLIEVISNDKSSDVLKDGAVIFLVVGFFKEHDEELSKASLMRKIYVATSAAPVIFLVVGWVTFPFIVCLVFHQEKLVKYVVAKHLKDREEEKVKEEQEGESEALEEIDVQEEEQKIGEKNGEKEIFEFVIDLKEPKIEVTGERKTRQE